MTKPPCKVNGVECQRRYPGCRAECEPYIKWMAKHKAERENEKEYKNNDADLMIIDNCIKGRRRRHGKRM